VILTQKRPDTVVRDMSSGADDSCNTEDYAAVPIPDTATKPREEWDYQERRSELLQRIREAGHPDELNQTELAERYDVSQQQISKDMRKIGNDIRKSLDKDRRALAVDSVIRRSIRGLLDNGEYMDAAQLALDWDDWVSDSSMKMGEKVGKSGADILLSDL
jgi:hypothetical protein